MKRLQNLIIQKKAYLFDGYAGKDESGRHPVSRLFLKYDNGAIYSARWSHDFPPDKVSKSVGIIVGFLDSLAKKATPAPPDPYYLTSELIYCGVEFTNHGLPVGEIQSSYFDLVTDKNGGEPKEVYFENRGGDRIRKTEYPATKQDVKDLYDLLIDMDVFKLDGYNVDDGIDGGTTYRISLGFSSGDKFKATWHAENPDPKVEAAFKKIWMFLYNVAERKKEG